MWAAVLAVSAMHATAAVGQANLIDQFTDTAGDDATSALLHQIFGPLFSPAGSGDGATSFSLLIGLFNSLLLAIAGVAFLYNASVAVLQSAHEGVVLGRRWSSIWAPLRVIVAVAMLVPVPGLGGYNSIQAAIGWTIRGSTSVAGMVWERGAQSLAGGTVAMTGLPAQFDPGLLRTIYRIHLCLRIINRQSASAGSARRARLVRQQGDDTVLLMSEIVGQRAGLCGAIALPLGDATDGGAPPGSSHQALIDGLIMHVEAMLDDVWEPALRQEPLPDLSSDIQRAIDRARARIAERSQALARSFEESGQARGALDAFLSGGDCPGMAGRSCPAASWINAGGWYMVLARFHARSVAALSAAPTATEPMLDFTSRQRVGGLVEMAAGPGPRVAGLRLDAKEARRLWLAAEGAMEDGASRLAASGMPVGTDALARFEDDSQSGLMAKMWNAVFRTGASLLIDQMSPSSWDRDPMIGIVNMGNWYLDVAATLMFGSAVTAILSSAFANAIIFLVAAPMVTIGVSLSFILPMLPFLYWILAVGAYVLRVVEAVVASSLWALAHMRLDGEGLSGPAGRQGWLNLLGLILTPTLMILGLFTGMILFRIIAGLMEAGLRQAMASLTVASPVVAIFGMIAAGALVVIGHLVILERSFSLIKDFPDRVLGWIGGNADLAGGEASLRASGGALVSTLGAGSTRLGGLLIRPASRSAG